MSCFRNKEGLHIIEVKPIGWVRSARSDLSDDYWGGVTSTIELDASQFTAAAVEGLEQFSHIEVVYFFHRVTVDSVVTGSGHPRENPNWPRVGIFAQRKKNRPNRLGITASRLVKVHGLKLTVSGIDAIDGTPVLDIKPYIKEFAPGPEDVRQPQWIGELMANYFVDAGKR